MIKNVTITILLCCMLFSCGVKGNPEYKDPKKKVKIHTILKDKV